MVYNYLSRPYLSSGQPSVSPLISVIISEIKDETSVKDLLDSLLKQAYQNIEVLVNVDKQNAALDNLLRDYPSRDKRVMLFDGVDIPDGWTKKNYARNQLSQLSKGQYLLFADSDVVVGDEVIANALSYMQLKGLSLLTIFPKHDVARQRSNALNSINHWLLLSNCPLKRIASSSKKSLSATSNQFMLFESSAYKTSKWHEKYKNSDDIDFVVGRFVKKSNLRMASLLCSDESVLLSTKVENNESLSIFAFNFFGRNLRKLIVYIVATTLGLLLAVFLLPFPLVFLYIFSILFSRMLYAVIEGKPILLNIVLQPVHHFIFLFSVLNFLKAKSGK